MRTSPGVNDDVSPLKGALVVLLCLGLATQVPANPSGRAVRAGEIRFQQRGDTLRVIQNSQQGIIDWDSFSIANGETTRFSQPNAQSATLNRVTGGSLSRIDGRLLANGRVFLLNSNGIVIGRDGVIDVAGFAASTLDVSNESFLGGGDLNFRGGSQAAVVNLGSISAFDGDIFLVAATVDNSGSLSAPRGTVGLAAGNDVLIRESGSERIFVRGASGGKKENGVINKGTVEANVAELKSYGGNVYGMAVKNEGRVAATGVTREGGQIFLTARGGRVRSTGSLKASRSDGSGGRVKVDSGRTESRTEIDGTVDASGRAGAGGEIVILGNEIEIFEGALILNDGVTMGGITRIGGGLRGQDPGFANAENTVVGNGARISADATGPGKGGQVIVFADGSLVFDGSVSARGGSLGGDGGFVELSGKENVRLANLAGRIDLSAPAGSTGTFLYDPTNISILPGSPNVGSPFTENTLYAGDIASFLATASLIVTTASVSGNDIGNITMDGAANITWDSASSLTFLADNDFVMNPGATISATGGGAFNVTAARSISVGIGASVTTTNGNLILSANQQNTASFGEFVGVFIDGATVQTTGSGNLDVFGRGGGGGETGGGQHGIRLINGAILSGGTTGTLTVQGTGGDADGDGNDGVFLAGSGTRIGSGGGNVSVSGTGGSYSYSANRGVHVRDGASIASGGPGTVTVVGWGGGIYDYGWGGNIGVLVTEDGIITSSGGNVSVTGTGGGMESSGNHGVFVGGLKESTSATISAGGAGHVFIEGIGGAASGSGPADFPDFSPDGDFGGGNYTGFGDNHGVFLLNAGAVNGSAGGAISITGRSNAASFASYLAGGASIQTNGGELLLRGDSLEIDDSATVASGSGTTTIVPLTPDFAIDLGGADSATFLGLSNHELSRVTAGTLQIGNSSSGQITGSAPIITHGNHLTLTTGAGATFNSSITMAANRNLAVNALGTTTGTISVLAALAASGTGTISLTTPRNIIFANDSSATTAGGSLTLSANAAGTTSGLFEGVYVGNGASINSGMGAISITGRGGDTINAGNHGIRLDSTSTVGSAGGNIFLTGQARGSAGANPTQEGIIVRGNITTTGSGNISLSGTGGNATEGNIGVHLFDDVLVSTIDGNILISGVSGAGTNSHGIQIADFASTPTVITSTGGSITLNGDGSAGSSPGINAFGSGVSIGGGTGAVMLEAIGDISFISGVGIGATGTGVVSLSATRGIALGSGASVSTVNGNLSISANQQTVPTIGNFAGVAIDGATVQATGSGVLSISGRGGDTGDSNFGINILNGGIVSGGTTGTTLLIGTGRGDTGTWNSGVNVTGAGSRIVSSGSNLSITGTGGAGTQSRGVFLGSSAQVSTTSAGGAITLTGIGTTGDNIGIEMNSGAITSSSGIILLDGLGAGAGRAISSSAATDSLGSNSSHVILNSSGGDVNFAGSVSAPGLLLLDATTSGDAGFILGNLSNDVDTLAAGGTNSSFRAGSIEYSDADGFEVGTVGGINGIAANGEVDLFSAGGGLEALEVNRSITSLGGAINLAGYDLTVRNSAISTTGTGTIDLTAVRALLVESESAISVVNGGLTLAANTAVTPLDGDFSGIEIGGAILSTSGTGTISLTGVGGNNAIGSTSVVDGIRLIDGAQLRSLSGNTFAGGITIDGTGGSGNLPNAGVLVLGSQITSIVGEISLTGQGGDSVSGGGDGIVIDGGAILRSTGSSETAAPVTLDGTGGATGSGNRGVVIQGPGSGIETIDGWISITGNGGGQGNGEFNRGVLISEASLVATGLGALQVIGNGGLGFNQIDGVQLENGALLRVHNGDLDIEGTAGGGLGYGVFATPTSGNLEVTGQGWLYVSGSGMNAAGVRLSNPVVGGTGAGEVVIGSLVHDVIVDSAVNAEGTITFDVSRDLITSGAVTSGTGDVEFIGRNVTINGLVSAPSGDISVEIGRGITSPGAGGTGAINADLVPGGALSFIGGAGGEDTLTYAGYSGSPITFDFDLLSGIENLVGTTFTTDQLNGPALAGSFLFTGSNVFEVNGVTVSGFENIVGGAEDDLFSFNAGGSISGSINGGGGTANEISYAGFATGAVLDLEVSASSGILGGFSNIQVFNGSPHLDTVIGLQAASTYQFSAAGLLTVGGFQVSGFDNLFAGPGNDTFVVGPGGGIPGTLNGGAGFDVLNYSGYGAPVSVNLGVPNATGFGGIAALESYIGTPFIDTFTGTNGNDTFTINADNAGNVNGSAIFTSFEQLRGGPGADRFLFLNQASVGSVEGGIGNDLLEIDDRTLGGTNTYTVTAGQIVRNPTYIFSRIEGIKLLLGPGNDTVVTRDFGLTQTFDGGAGNDILDMGPGVFLAGSPMPLGSSTIFHTGFEGPLAPNTPPGEVLQVQTGNVPSPQQDIDFQVEDRFTPGNDSAMPSQNLLQALSQQGGNAFSAVLAGQAVVLQIDGQQYLFGVPANLDGSLTPPPAEIIAQLRENLRADGWAELADALGFEGPMTLVSLDGPIPVDLSTPIPPELLPILASSLATDAARELFDALGMVVFVPIAAADGAVSLFAIAIPIDDAIRALLLEQLNEAAFTELSEALEL